MPLLASQGSYRALPASEAYLRNPNHNYRNDMHILTRFSLIALLSLFLVGSATAQNGQVPASPKASISQTIGADTKITFDYSRPAVKGREVWGGLVPYGMAEGNQYSDEKPYPWRAGANENTTVTFGSDVTVAGEPLAAGTYSIHMIPDETGEWTVIFNKATDGWGSYKYDEGQDALRVMVTPTEAPMAEWLTYGFDDITPSSTQAYLHWAELKVPFEIGVTE